MLSTLLNLLIGIAASIAGWLVLNFVGKPIVAFQEKRREALEVGERYAFVSNTSSDEHRSKAVKALADVGNALRGYNREQSVAIRAWCWLWEYDLDIAARCLFGLADAARGEFSISEETQKNTLNGLFLALGVKRHLSAAEIQTLRNQIAEARSGGNS